MIPVKSIRILNKNNMNAFDVDEAPVFIEVKSEVLDSGVVTISNQTQKIDIEPYDIVALLGEDDDFIKYMCVDTYTEIMTCINPRIYRYEIHLFSETKMLEGIVLPNLKITKLLDAPPWSIYHYIDQYMSEYCPKIRVNSSSPYVYTSKWIWDDDSHIIKNKFDSIPCPELQWNTPTLREVLNDLMMVVDCIPVLKNGRLEFIDLTSINNKDWSNDNSHINYVTRSKSSEDYVSELQVELKNVTSKEENVNNIVTRAEYVTFGTTVDKAVSTSDDTTLRTRYPIYNLKSVTIMFPISYQRDNNYYLKWHSQEITSLGLVPEYQEWLTRNVKYGGTPSFDDWKNYQNYSFFYTRGSNEIQNFGNTNKVLGILSTLPLYQLLCGSIVRKNAYSDAIIGKYPKWYNILFKVEYETLEGCLFRASKNGDIEHDRVVIDNQTNSMVDSYAQGYIEYQKANRLGNEQLQINARFSIDDDLMEIGDIFEDCVIYQVQYQFYKDHTEVNAVATKNYILREYFTGVSSRRRSWQIVSGNEALVRHDIEKYYYEFSYFEHNETNGLENLEFINNDLYSPTSPVLAYNANPLKYCFVRTRYGNTYYPGQKTVNETPRYYFLIDLISRVVGNSIVFSVGFDDNYYAGKSYSTIHCSPQLDKYISQLDIKNNSNEIIIDDDVLNEGGVPMFQHTYVTSFGLCNDYELTFAYDMNYLIYQNDPVDGDDWGTVNQETLPSKTYNFLFEVYQRPMVEEKVFYYPTEINRDFREFKTTITHKKDSSEIAQLSVQFEFTTDTMDICFGKEWITRQQLIAINNNNLTNYRVYLYSKNKYNFRKPNYVPEGLVDKVCTVIIDTVNRNNSKDIYIVLTNSEYMVDNADDAKEIGVNLNKSYCFYLNDTVGSEHLNILAFKDVPFANWVGYELTTDEFYPAILVHLNLLKTRNKNIYSSTNHYFIVGKI